MTAEEFIELSQARKRQLNTNKPTKKDIVPPVEDNREDRDLEEVMTIESEPEKSKAYLEEVDRQALSDYKAITDMELEKAYPELDEATNSVFDSVVDGIKNIGRGAGKNIARYSAALNDGVSKLLDVTNPYTWVTGNKTNLSNFFKKAAEKNRELYNEWDKNSEGSKIALASEFILDPALLLPSGVASTGSKLSRIGKSALAGAGIGSGVSYLKDYGAGGTGFENMGLGAGAGAGVNAVIAGLTRGKAPNLSGMADNYNPNLTDKYSLKKEVAQIGKELKDASRNVIDKSKTVSDKAKDKFINTYKQKVMPLTASGRERLLKDDFRNAVLKDSMDDTGKSMYTPPASLYDDVYTSPFTGRKVLNNSNIDEALYHRPTVLNSENFESLSNPIKKQQVKNRIKEINKQLKNENKYKSTDDIISEYEFKDSLVLNKEYDKIRKAFNKDFNAFKNNLKSNNELSDSQYIDMLNKYKENFFKTDNGRKFNALKDEFLKRLTKEPVEDYVSNKSVRANNIDTMPVSHTDYDNIADVNTSVRLDDNIDNIPAGMHNNAVDTTLNNSDIRADGSISDIENITHQKTPNKPILNEISQDNINIPQGNIPALTGKNIELYDGATGEVVEIPEEILEIIKKKALMNY